MTVTAIHQPARYISPADTAKLIRVALKKEFPAVKFSVRTSVYSSGASIDVRWQDGPPSKMVERITGKFAGATFDGMIDLKSYHDSDLNGERVRFGANFVFATRSLSRPALGQVLAVATRKYGIVTTITAYGGYDVAGANYHDERRVNELVNTAYCDASGRIIAYAEVK